jgi:hypothetical protein
MRPTRGGLLFYPLLFALSGNANGASVDVIDMPPELKRLVGKGESLLAYASADLNGDGLRDVVFIVESKAPSTKPQEEEGLRTLKIAVRSADGALKVVKQNGRVVYCRSCGGAFGDPFDSLEASGKRFTIHHYGGSGWRWANAYTFAYSKRESTWQLVRVEESSFHASDPDKMESKTHRPPRSFGKIDIVEFDPAKFLGVGPK